MLSSPMRVAVLTVSDRCSRGQAVDTSGPGLCEMARQKLGAEIVATACVSDDQELIADTLRKWSQDPAPDLILTTGGTGLAPRDVTPEATLSVLDREHMGLIQLMQMRCYAKTPMTYLSRGVAGTIRRSLVINLPGSRKGSAECFEALLDLLPHAIAHVRDELKDHGPLVR